MAAIKFKSALGVDRSCEEGFGGIDRTSRGKSDNGCYRMENLDPQADGSLATRPAYKPVSEFSGEFRGSFYSADKIYALTGRSLVLTDTSLGTSQTIAELPSETGNSEIFCFNGDIYVHDGNTLYRYTGTALTEVEGYAPLYGKDWDPETGGEICEDINVLSDRIRISFILTEKSKSYNIGIHVSSIDRVELNGKEYPVDELNFKVDSTDSTVLNSMLISDSALLTLWLTLSPESSQKHRLQKDTKAFVFGNNGGERLCFFNPGISGHLLCSLPISQNSHLSSQITDKNALPLYIPASSSACIGNGASPITGMAQHYGRALLFTDTDTWCVDWEGDEKNCERATPKIFMLNSAVGSELTRGFAYCDNDPLTYFCGSLWRWHSQSGVRDECSASLISDEVAEYLPKASEHISMLSIPQRQMIMISAAEDPEGKILVYNTHLKSWTLYSGIFAEDLLRWGDLPAFVRGGCIYAFSEDLSYDAEEDENFPITSLLVSHFTDLGCPERKKGSVSMILSADLGGGSADLTFENEIGEKRSWQISGNPDGGLEQFSERFYLPGFKKIRYSIATQKAVTYRSIIISAK